MNITNRMILAALWLGLSAPALALDPAGAVVKVTPLLKTATSWNGDPIVYPEGKAEITGLLIELAPGGETGWHLHPVPSFGLILEGTLEVALKDGRSKRFQSGEAIAEVVNTMHNGRNVGDTPVKILVFYTGAAGHSLTVMER